MPASTRGRTTPLAASAIGLLLASGAVADPTTQDQMMFFRAYVQDAPDCAVAVQDGKVVFPGIAAPAASCPDAYAWAAFLTSIRDGFWTWAQDGTAWPAQPLPLCAAAGQADCCDPSVLDQARPIAGAPDEGCPYAPGDYANPPARTVEPSNRHSPTFVNRLDPARELRDEEVELVFRNAPMLRYIFEQNLYSKEGLGARFRALNATLAAGVPFHPTELEVRFPEDAIMAKADWVHQRHMLAMGLVTDRGPGGEALDPPQNPDFPYVTVYLEGKAPEDSGYYYLVGMTNSSKALPGWHWYAIEHVANLGRCDFIGCNDSFGYQAKGVTVEGRSFGRNYIPPHPLTDAAPGESFPAGYGKPYLPAETGEVITADLQALFQGLGVATAATDADPRLLDPADPAWASYRLKGTQTNYVTDDGVATLMGASVTEGGFVNSASCMTCHSTATTDAYGNPGVPGIGSMSRLNLFGFQDSASGAPQEAWFFSYGTPVYEAVQIDFVWGILNASCVKPAEDAAGKAAGHCASYDGVVLTWPGKQ